jgi:hypothetical protein
VEKKEYKYEIDGKTYIQRPFVIGQIGQMMEVLKGIGMPSSIDALGIAKLLGDKLPDTLAIILTEEGTQLRDKNLPELAEIFREYMDIATGAEIIEHFFNANPIVSIFERLTRMVAQIVPLKTVKTTEA